MFLYIKKKKSDIVKGALGVGIQVFWVLIEESPLTMFDSTLGLEVCEARPYNLIENSRAPCVPCALDETLKPKALRSVKASELQSNIALIPLQVHMPFQTICFSLIHQIFKECIHKSRYISVLKCHLSPTCYLLPPHLQPHMLR